MRPTPLIAAFFFLLQIAYRSAHGQYYFDKITVENGLSDNRVTCFLKDKTGFVWIGTKNGLNRYDGNSFKIFKPSDNNSISNEEINDIVEDSTGRLWVATANGLNIYDPFSDQWQTLVPTSSDVKDDIPSYLIWDLAIDEKNRVWIVSDVWELSVYDPVAKKFTYYDWPAFKNQPQFKDFPGYRSIKKIQRKSETEWWLGTSIGLFSVDIASNLFRFFGSGFSGNIMDLVYDKENGKLYLVPEAGNLFCYDEKAGQYKEISISCQPYPAKEWKKNKQTANTLLLAHPAGMLEIDRQTLKAINNIHQPSLSSSLSPGGTNIIYRDDTGIVWTGTNHGVNYFNSRNKSVDFIPLTVVSDKAGADGMSAAYFDERDNKYYVTSLNPAALFIIDGNNGAVSTISSINGKPLSPCTNICADSKNNLWLLTVTHVFRYHRRTKSFSEFITPNNGKGVIFNDMIEDRSGNYWFATWREGAYRYNVKEKTFSRFPRSSQARNITSLLNDPKENAVWIGSFNTGVYRYDLITDSIINYTESETNPDYMKLVLVRDIEKDDGGKLWLAMYGAGLYMYRHGFSYGRSFTRISSRQGLTNSSYYSIASDNHKRLWLLSGKGISAIDSSGKFLYDVSGHPALRFTNYAPDDIYQKRIFYNKSLDELLVPVAGGLLVYNPVKMVPVVNFPVVITDISIGGRSVIYDSSLRMQSHIDIPYRFNSVSFRFAALIYNKQDIRYEYKLHETDAGWTSIGSSASVNFPDLPPGYYTLMVRAKDASGHLSSNTVYYSFRIVPPFWRTWWFISLLALAIGFAFYQWTVYLRRKIKAQKILNYFATSLYGQNTVEDICWDVAKNCISQLQFEDCVVYLYDPVRKVLLQKAAYGPKNPQKHEIVNAIEIPIGKGIVGSVAQTGKAEIIPDTSADSRYIVDDERRYSEITVPVFLDGKIFGIIDSEHRRRNFYKKYHLRLLQDIAAVCSDKISKYIIEERLRSKISRDLHDEIGSALSSINVLSKVALSKAGDKAEIASYLSKIKNSTFQTMESMSDIVWAINPKNDKLEALISRMKEFAADICEARGIVLSFNLPAELEAIPVDLSKRKNIFLIFKEAVNNAVKYSECSLLQILFQQNGSLLKMIIKDNGKGFDQQETRQGNGLLNMQERAVECDGHVTILSSPQQGTSITLEIPIPRFGVLAGK